MPFFVFAATAATGSRHGACPIGCEAGVDGRQDALGHLADGGRRHIALINFIKERVSLQCADYCRPMPLEMPLPSKFSKQAG